MSEHSPSTLDVAELSWALMQAAHANGFEIEEFGKTEPVPLFALRREIKNPVASIYISAGIHGDEPASSLAILHLLQTERLPENISITLCPMLNPEGLVRGTRENRVGVDLNRDYLQLTSYEAKCHVTWLDFLKPRWDLALFLHEDWESNGFYLYELNPENKPSLAPDVLKNVLPIIPIEEAEEIDGWAAVQGLIKPNVTHEDRDDWPETLYLWAKGYSLWNYTFETPSSLPLKRRVQAHVAAVMTAIGKLVPVP